MQVGSRLDSVAGALENALTTKLDAHHRFLLAEQSSHLDKLEARLVRFRPTLRRGTVEYHLGVGRATAEVLVAGLGIDMSCFPNPAKPVTR
jgi:hypothetical protein